MTFLISRKGGIMTIRLDRIKKAQELMKKNNFMGIMIMNHDDYQYFFGESWVQPRAIIPAIGDPIVICFKSEERSIKERLGIQSSIQLWTHVGEQMFDVKKSFQKIANNPELQTIIQENNGRPKIGMQLFFNTPAFLVDLFKKINKDVDLVASDPIMDELRVVKEEEEINNLKKAQSIACKGMDKVRQLLKPGITGNEIATETLYIMMKEGATGTSTPIHINIGDQSSWIHGKTTSKVVQEGDIVVVDLTPQYQGYCANLARTFVIGHASSQQKKLIETYLKMKEETRKLLIPGNTPKILDDKGKEICEDHELGEYHINGISHGIGLRFEETPATTIVPAQRTFKLRKNMTMTIGHTILADPEVGGVRFEDIYRVSPSGGEILFHYPLDNWLIN